MRNEDQQFMQIWILFHMIVTMSNDLISITIESQKTLEIACDQPFFCYDQDTIQSWNWWEILWWALKIQSHV